MSQLYNDTNHSVAMNEFIEFGLVQLMSTIRPFRRPQRSLLLSPAGKIIIIIFFYIQKSNIQHWDRNSNVLLFSHQNNEFVFDFNDF